jgi:hypothetical protein
LPGYLLDVETTQQDAHHTDPLPPGLDDALTEIEARRFRNIRRIGVLGLVALIVVTAAGLLGQKTNRVTATGAGYVLTVTYPSVVRPGLDVRFEVSVFNQRGFGKSLTLSFERHYFDIFDLNSLRADADSSRADASHVYYTWNSVPGTTFHFSLDMYAEYGEHLGADGATAIVASGKPVATARYHTRWVP